MSLATSHRPYTFSEVVGQEGAVAALKGIAMAEGVKVRSILLLGSYGSGKSTLSRLFGRAVNCETFKKTGDVCKRGEECPACKEAQMQNSRTYIEYDSTRVGSVDQIRDMDTIFSSAVKGRRVLNFDEVHTASKAAQSALLKVLEEGVKDTFFVFTTTDAVLETIKSRSVVIDIGTVPLHLVKERARVVANEEGIEITENELDALALKSKGHMRDALSILEHYELAGPVSLKTSLKLLKKFILATIKREDPEEVIHQIMLYPIVDIKNSISVMIKDFFVSEEKFDSAVRAKGYHHKIFQYFYSPVAQEALKDEYGIEILLRSFYERFGKN